MATLFKKATRKQAKIKLAITGASGSGKTFSALRMAQGLSGGKPVAVIDTENGSASLYSDRFGFDVLDLSPPFSHDKFVEAINAAQEAGYEVLVIDSASHFWEGILDYKSKLDSRGGNSYTNWAEAGAKFKGILDAVLQSKMHVICCLRSKMDHVIEDNGGRKTIRKVGLAPIMRDGIEYEFTVVFDVAMDHNASASKDRTGLFADKIAQITEQTGKTIVEWLGSGEAVAAPVAEADDTENKAQLIDAIVAHPKSAEATVCLAKLKKTKLEDCNVAELSRIISYLDKKGAAA